MLDATHGAQLGAKALKQVAQAIRDNERRMRNAPPEFDGFSSEQVRRPAVIGSTLTAPASSLAAATNCTVYFLVRQLAGTQVLNSSAYTAYNDDPEVTAEIGTYCRLEFLNGRWMIYYIGCEPQQALVDALP